MIGDWLQSGAIGEISVLRGVFNFRLEERDNVQLVPEWGGGSLWDVGIYPLSYAQYVMGGPPEWVVGDQWQGDTGVDESFVGQMHYAGGRLAQITSSFRTPFHMGIEIFGSNGRLLVTRPFNDMTPEETRVTFYPAYGEAQELPVPQKELYIGEVEDMHAAILDGAQPYLSLTETRNHVRTALALYQSARERQIITL